MRLFGWGCVIAFVGGQAGSDTVAAAGLLIVAVAFSLGDRERVEVPDDSPVRDLRDVYWQP